MLRTFVFVFPVSVGQVGWGVVPYLLDCEVGMCMEMVENFVSKAADENGDGIDF
jgi:hypothetical protein